MEEDRPGLDFRTWLAFGAIGVAFVGVLALVLITQSSDRLSLDEINREYLPDESFALTRPEDTVPPRISRQEAIDIAAKGAFEGATVRQTDLARLGADGPLAWVITYRPKIVRLEGVPLNAIDVGVIDSENHDGGSFYALVIPGVPSFTVYAITVIDANTGKLLYEREDSR